MLSLGLSCCNLDLLLFIAQNKERINTKDVDVN